MGAAPAGGIRERLSPTPTTAEDQEPRQFSFVLLKLCRPMKPPLLRSKILAARVKLGQEGPIPDVPPAATSPLTPQPLRQPISTCTSADDGVSPDGHAEPDAESTLGGTSPMAQACAWTPPAQLRSHSPTPPSTIDAPPTSERVTSELARLGLPADCTLQVLELLEADEDDGQETLAGDEAMEPLPEVPEFTFGIFGSLCPSPTAFAADVADEVADDVVNDLAAELEVGSEGAARAPAAADDGDKSGRRSVRQRKAVDYMEKDCTEEDYTAVDDTDEEPKAGRGKAVAKVPAAKAPTSKAIMSTDHRDAWTASDDECLLWGLSTFGSKWQEIAADSMANPGERTANALRCRFQRGLSRRLATKELTLAAGLTLPEALTPEAMAARAAKRKITALKGDEAKAEVETASAARE